MRSRPPITTIGWYKTATFDLIRHGLWPVTPSPPGEGLTQKYRAGSSEESPLLLTEGGTAQAVTGVEGTRCVLSNCSEI